MGRSKLRRSERNAVPEEGASFGTYAKDDPPVWPDTSERQALDRAVDELYLAFGARKLSRNGPAICTFCCAPEAVAERIRDASTPRNVTFEDLSEFHSAAKSEEVAEDMAFLLPRTLEFVGRGREPNTVGLFALFAHHFPRMWAELSDRERDAVHAYCRALVRWHLSLPPGATCNYGLSDIIEMAAAGGFGVDPILDELSEPPATDRGDDALIDLVLDRAEFWQRPPKLFQTDATVAAHIARRLRAAVAAPSTIARLERLALSDDDPLRTERASLAHDIAENEAGMADRS